MLNLKYLALALVVGLALCPLIAASQLPTRPPNTMEKLNKEAEASDPAGIHEYSQDLIQKLVGVRAGRPAYADELTNRLARAEMMARHGKRKLISEEAIANAFNDLMQRTAAPSSFKADVAEVEKSRLAFENELPAMISESRNGKYCYPGEAIWVVVMLIENVGAHFPPLLNSVPQVSGYVPPVRLHIEQYFSSHSPNEVAHVLDRLAKNLGI